MCAQPSDANAPSHALLMHFGADRSENGSYPLDDASRRTSLFPSLPADPLVKEGGEGEPAQDG